MRRVYSSGLKRGPLSAELLVSTLDASRSIGSDYELASLLMQVVKQQSIDAAHAQFFAALSTIEGDYEHRRVLAALAARPDLSSDVTATMLKSVAGINSDYEAAEFLLQVARTRSKARSAGRSSPRSRHSAAPTNAAACCSRSSGAATSRAETLQSALRAAGTMPAGYELSQVLQAAARNHAITGPTRDIYIKLPSRSGNTSSLRRSPRWSEASAQDDWRLAIADWRLTDRSRSICDGRSHGLRTAANTAARRQYGTTSVTLELNPRDVYIVSASSAIASRPSEIYSEGFIVCHLVARS